MLCLSVLKTRTNVTIIALEPTPMPMDTNSLVNGEMANITVAKIKELLRDKIDGTSD